MTLLLFLLVLGCCLSVGAIAGVIAYLCAFRVGKRYDSTCPHCAPDEIERSVAG